MSLKTLIFIPTYNELQNAPALCAEIHQLGLDADVLFLDDNSPDGTGAALDALKTKFPRLVVHHRPGKMGIGSAHFDGINWAYDQGYELVVSLDCDFTHSPSDIPAMITAAQEADVAVGSRWLCSESLPGWNIFRRAMTNLGHLLTRQVLGLPYDASGAFRAYRLDHIPREIFSLIKSREYSFFFESLFILSKAGLTIKEVPIVLPARTYGSSKMTTAAAYRSARYVFELAIANLRRPEQFLLEPRDVQLDKKLNDPQGWDTYWENTQGSTSFLYDLIAAFYRQTFIRRNIERVIRREFKEGSELIHAGCGSGQVDSNLSRIMRVTALDISPPALRLYSRNNPRAAAVVHGSILALPFPDQSFDGFYNMGVVEHFTHDEIHTILQEARRVLRPDGKIVIFWPHARATSVFVLHVWHWILHNILKSKTQLHPAEVSLIKSRKEATAILQKAGFELSSYSFGYNDLFVQAVVVAKKSGAR
jgi:dolichol-phosphate mannosyltransferase